MDHILTNSIDIIPHNDVIYTFNYLVSNIKKAINENYENNMINEYNIVNNEIRKENIPIQIILSQFILSMENLFIEIKNGNILENKYSYINWLLKKPFLIDMSKLKISLNYDCKNILINLNNFYDYIAYTVAYLIIQIIQKDTKLFPIEYIIVKYKQYIKQFN